jgi:carbon-monoxide dehydrogenase large subunit
VPRVGTPVERLEDLRLLRGEGRYLDDFHVPGMLHAAIVRSVVPHGRLLGIDTSAARALPGVAAVFTAAEVAEASGGKVPIVPLRIGSLPQLEPYGQPVIAGDKVRYVGEPLAIVVAETPAIAEDAADLVVADIEALPPVVDRAGASLLFDDTGTNVAITYTATKGDVSAVAATYRRKERFAVHRHSAAFLEPRGLLAQWNGAATRMDITGSAKVPYSNRRMLAHFMDLPEDCIEMHWSDFGGGFGVRGEVYPEDVLVPFASRRLRRPVKWVEDRRENLLAANHAREIECELEIACAADGAILSLSGHAHVNVGAYLRMSGWVQPRNVAQFIAGPYRVPNVLMQSSVIVSNKAPSGAYRGPGRFEADFFRERLMDMAARDLGIDPVAFRRRNLVTAAEQPYRVADLSPVDSKNEHFDGGEYSLALDRCLAEIGWAQKAPQQGLQPDGRYHGLGIGCFVEGGGAGPKETARFIADGEGGIDLHVGSTNLGQGMETVFTQIAADALGLPMARIRLFHGGTGVLKEGFGSYHSRSVVMGGSAVLDAAQKLKAAITAAAAKRFGCEPGQVKLGEGLGASHGSASATLAELARDAKDGLAADGTFATHHHTYAYGAAAAHVSVDPRTGHVQLLDYVTVEDLGRVINPLTCTGQAIGAVVQGLGGTFLEHLAYDAEGQFLAGSLADYLLPTATDFPRIRAVLLEHSPSPHNPLGAKGGGEGGIVPVGGVISNAVAAALAPLGVQLRELPITPVRVWELVNAGSSGGRT